MDRALSTVVPINECKPGERKTAHLDIRLDAETANLLKAPGGRHQVRLFCATKSMAQAAESSPNYTATIEFPLSCELKVNNHAYSASLKGNKKNPGRVPPPNLNKDKTLFTRDGMTNKIELIYTNAYQKYVMVAALCSITDVETIVAKLKAEKRRSREQVIGSMKKAAAEDDIELGTSTLSLRDPLSYSRITAPCRSSLCTHSQCFDATFFFLSNEQTPSWTCPHCSKIVPPESLFIDGYFEDILKRLPADEDVVEVEPDGSWRSKDRKVTSSSDGVPAATSHSNGNGGSSASSTAGPSVKQDPEASSRTSQVPSTAQSSAEIILLDDSPSPPPRSAALPGSTATREPGSSASTSAGPSSNGRVASSTPATSQFIDLTFSDSEDEEEEIPLSRPAPTHRPAQQPQQPQPYRPAPAPPTSSMGPSNQQPRLGIQTQPGTSTPSWTPSPSIAAAANHQTRPWLPSPGTSSHNTQNAIVDNALRPSPAAGPSSAGGFSSYRTPSGSFFQSSSNHLTSRNSTPSTTSTGWPSVRATADQLNRPVQPNAASTSASAAPLGAARSTTPPTLPPPRFSVSATSSPGPSSAGSMRPPRFWPPANGSAAAGSTSMTGPGETSSPRTLYRSPWSDQDDSAASHSHSTSTTDSTSIGQVRQREVSDTAMDTSSNGASASTASNKRPRVGDSDERQDVGTRNGAESDQNQPGSTAPRVGERSSGFTPIPSVSPSLSATTPRRSRRSRQEANYAEDEDEDGEPPDLEASGEQDVIRAIGVPDGSDEGDTPPIPAGRGRPNGSQSHSRAIQGGGSSSEVDELEYEDANSGRGNTSRDEYDRELDDDNDGE